MYILKNPERMESTPKTKQKNNKVKSESPKNELGKYLISTLLDAKSPLFDNIAKNGIIDPILKTSISEPNAIATERKTSLHLFLFDKYSNIERKFLMLNVKT